MYLVKVKHLKHTPQLLALNPGSLSWGERRAWYTLSAHAPKFSEILTILTSLDFSHRNVLCEGKVALAQYISMEKSATLNIF